MGGRVHGVGQKEAEPGVRRFPGSSEFLEFGDSCSGISAWKAGSEAGGALGGAGAEPGGAIHSLRSQRPGPPAAPAARSPPLLRPRPAPGARSRRRTSSPPRGALCPLRAPQPAASSGDTRSEPSLCLALCHRKVLLRRAHYPLHAASRDSTPLSSGVVAAAASALQDQRGSKGTAWQPGIAALALQVRQTRKVIWEAGELAKVTDRWLSASQVQALSWTSAGNVDMPSGVCGGQRMCLHLRTFRSRCKCPSACFLRSPGASGLLLFLSLEVNRKKESCSDIFGCDPQEMMQSAQPPHACVCTGVDRYLKLAPASQNTCPYATHIHSTLILHLDRKFKYTFIVDICVPVQMCAHVFMYVYS
ncbi:uncharacterized protein LOC116537716 [Sapajus apella]|uniref:Uncharacterized protein LOC116537716 n=1 Tax=Sapajus apella TaxID=9515 RepID=A0A6J3GDM1_SAPAP|nr:uncharacterized protein LOC116537716 [Sapajus apella]